MRNLVGMKWYQLTQEERDNLLLTANAVDSSTGNEPKKTGECTVDFTETNLSVIGHIAINEEENVITVDDDSIIYAAENGVIAD